MFILPHWPEQLSIDYIVHVCVVPGSTVDANHCYISLYMFCTAEVWTVLKKFDFASLLSNLA